MKIPKDPKQSAPTARVLIALVSVVSVALLAYFIGNRVFNNGVDDPAEHRLKASGDIVLSTAAPNPTLARAAIGPSHSKVLLENEFQDISNGSFPVPVMVNIPAGSFEMGSDRMELGFNKNEFPKHNVTISSSFAMGKYEVTEAEFGAFLKDTGRQSVSDCELYEDFSWVVSARADYIAVLANNALPAICVSWNDAHAYAEWLSLQTGYTYRLPTEEEWEYAARAGTSTSYSFGNAYEDGCTFMNGVDAAAKATRPELIGTVCNDGYAELAPVGSLQPNKFGLHDVHGNAWEWTADTWTSSHGEDAWDSDAHVMKGGSWFSYPLWLRSANRNSLEADRRRMDVGFRIVRELDASPER